MAFETWNDDFLKNSDLVSPSDVFESFKKSLVSDVDVDILFEFYAPIISAKSVLLYLLLLRLADKGSYRFSDFFLHYQIKQVEFANWLPPLEAIGLVKSYSKNEGDHKCYHYHIYSPKTPNEFFTNELLHALFVRYVDTKDRDALKAKYSVSKDEEEKGMKEISIDFSSYFQLDASSLPPLEKDADGVLSKDSASFKLTFDRNAFFKALSEYLPDANVKSFTKEEIIRLARISTMYNLDESALASLTAISYSPNEALGKRIDFDKLRSDAIDYADKHCYSKKGPEKAGESLAKGSSGLAKMMRRMDNMSSVEFLKGIQGGHKPAKSDLILVDRLINDIGLPESVVNALLFYVLMNNDNILSANYAEKLGATLVRKGINNAVDAWNCLNSQRKPRAKASVEPLTTEKAPQKKEKPMAKAEESEDDDFESVLNSL